VRNLNYKGEEQSKIVAIILHVYLIIMEWNQQKGIEIEEDIFQKSLITNLYRHIVFLKNPAFLDEKEVRWVYTEDQKMFDDGTLAPKHFRVDHNILIPYVTTIDIINIFKLKGLPVSNSKSRLLPLREVIVGPQENADLVECSVREFLEGKGYHSVTVKKSNVPFRPTRPY